MTAENPFAEPVNRALPVSYQSLLPAEARRLEEEILLTIKGRTPADLRRACRQISDFRSLKYRFGEDSKIKIALSLWEVVVGGDADGPASLPLPTRVRVIKSLDAFLEQLGSNSEPCLEGKLILPWRALMRELDANVRVGSGDVLPESGIDLECSLGGAISRLCHSARKFFAPSAASEIYASIEEQLLATDCTVCFDALSIMSGFLPTRAEEVYTAAHLSQWIDAWCQIDHCPAWDSMWLQVICNARKYGDIDWSAHLLEIFSLARRSLRISSSSGGASVETRGVPLRSRKLTGYLGRTGQHSVDMRPLAKLIVSLMGWGGDVVEMKEAMMRMNVPVDELGGDITSASEKEQPLSTGTHLLLLLFRSVRVYFHPSNSGRWSGSLALLLASVCAELAQRVGYEHSVPAKKQTKLWWTGPQLSRADVGAVVDSLLPLVHELLYAKSRSLGSLGERSLCALASFCPNVVASRSVPFIMMALDPVGSINFVHQAPSAMLALARLAQPLLHPCPYIAPYLIQLLEWSLPGIDPNDFTKSFAALNLFAGVLTWTRVPIRDPTDLDTAVKWFDRPYDAHGGDEDAALFAAMDDTVQSLPGLGLACLERILLLIEHRGEIVKSTPANIDHLSTAAAMAGVGGPSSSGAGASIGTARDELLTRCIQIVAAPLFASFGSDTLPTATRMLTSFALNSPAASTAKDMSLLLKAAARVNADLILHEVLPLLLDDLLHKRAQSIAYRVRLLSGAVRYAGRAIIPYMSRLINCLHPLLGATNKDVRKAACKLLRHLLSCLSESYTLEAPISRDSTTDVYSGISWHLPSPEELRLAGDLISEFALRPLESAARSVHLGGTDEAITSADCRHTLKAVYYCMRGCVSNEVDGGICSGDAEAHIHSLSQLRTCSLQMFHRFREHALMPDGSHERCPDGKIVKMVLTIGEMASVLRGPSGSKLAQDSAVNRVMMRSASSDAMLGASKALLDALPPDAPYAERREIAVSYRRHTPTAIAEKVELHHRQRQDIESFAIARMTRRSPEIRGYVTDLVLLSQHSFAIVRSAAQASVNVTGSYLGFVLDDELRDLLSRRLTASDSPHAVITGGIYLLAQPRSLRRQMDSWSFLHTFVDFLCSSSSLVAGQPPDLQEKMATRLQILLIRYIVVSAPPPFSDPADKQHCVDLVGRLLDLAGAGSVPGGGSDFGTSPSPSQFHWRYALMAGWAITHLMKRAAEVEGGPLASARIYQLFVAGLTKSGDGQPMQNLSLSAFGILLATTASQPSSYGLPQSEILALMTDKKVLAGLVRAIAHSHSEAYHNSAREQWSVGVSEVLNDASWRFRMATAGHLPDTVPTNRLAQDESPHFARHNVCLVELLLTSCGNGVLEPLLRCAQETLSQAVPDEKRLFQYTITEIVAGVVRAYTRASSVCTDGLKDAMWAMILPLMEKEISNCSYDVCRDWTGMICSCIPGSNVESMEPLISLLEARVTTVVQSSANHDSFSQHAKWLRLLPSAIMELPLARAGRLCNHLAKPLASVIGYVFKACREEIARCLMIMMLRMLPNISWALEVADCMVAATLEAGAAEDTARSLSLLTISRTLTGEDGATSPPPKESSRGGQSLCRETLLMCLGGMIWCSDAARYLPIVSHLLPAAFDCLADPSMETSSMARIMLSRMGWSVQACRRAHLDSCQPSIANILADKMAGDVWQIRLGAMEYCGAFQASHLFLQIPSERQMLLQVTLRLLQDERREVQEIARTVLTLRLSQVGGGEALNLSKEFIMRSREAVSAAKRRRLLKSNFTSASSSEAAVALQTKQREAAVLGLSSCILAYPYDIPEFLPQVIVALGAHSDGRSLVKETVTAALKDFRRTRTGAVWQSQRRCFTQEQLEALDDLSEIPSYFS